MKTEKIIMALACRKEEEDRVIQNRAFVLHPDYRGLKLANRLFDYLDELFEKSGADLVYGLVSTQHPLAQKLAFYHRAQIGGFIPGIMRRTTDGKNYFRDVDLVYFKFYNGAETSCVPFSQCVFLPETTDSIQGLLDEAKKNLNQNS